MNRLPFTASLFHFSSGLKTIAVLFLLFIATPKINGQSIYYAELNKKEKSNLDFQIIGKSDDEVMIYKNIDRKHVISYYNMMMNHLEDVELDFIPEKTIKVDFIKCADSLIVVYSFEKNKHIICNAMIMKRKTQLFPSPIQLDEASIGFFAQSDIYSVVPSDNKQKFLLYKKQLRNNKANLLLKTYDIQINLIDSVSVSENHDNQNDFYSELIIDNDGNVAFAHQFRNRSIDNFDSLTLAVHFFQDKALMNFPIDLKNHYLEKSFLKADNINHNIIVNAYYNSTKRGNAEGLFSAKLSLMNKKATAAFNILPKSFRSTITSSVDRGEIDNMEPKQILIKRNGAFVFIAEDSYTETMNNNNWNRNYNPVFSGTNDINFNNGYNSNGNNAQNNSLHRYYCNNIVVAAVDSSLSLTWSNSITKRQMDADNDNYLSFTQLNQGKEINFIYLDRDNQRYVLSRQSITPEGTQNRYPTIKCNEPQVEFMPRRSKQVGANQLIIPFTYLNQIGFALLDF